jgi:hypothetical protein
VPVGVPKRNHAWPQAQPLTRDSLSQQGSAPCRYLAALSRRQHFFGGVTDAYDILGVGASGELRAIETKFYGGSGWETDARAFANDKIVMLHDAARALSRLGLIPDEHPDQQRLFEPDDAVES